MARLTDLAGKWMKSYKTRKKMLDQVVLKKMNSNLPTLGNFSSGIFHVGRGVQLWSWPERFAV